MVIRVMQSFFPFRNTCWIPIYNFWTAWLCRLSLLSYPFISYAMTDATHTNILFFSFFIIILCTSGKTHSKGPSRSTYWIGEFWFSKDWVYRYSLFNVLMHALYKKDDIVNFFLNHCYCLRRPITTRKLFCCSIRT